MIDPTDLPEIKSVSRQLPYSVRRVVDNWFKRGIPRSAQILAEYPELYTATVHDWERLKHLNDEANT
jgi:hypothetical protein